MTKIGINGFGRIGRLAFRAAVGRKDIEIVGINDLVDPEYMAYMLKYDSTHGKFEGTVEAKDGALIVNGKKIRVTAEKDPANLKWNEVGAEIIIESTGLFLHPVVMTPGSHCYFDHYQSTDHGEPLAIGGYTPLEKVYAFEPIPQGLTAEEQTYILGAQANIWTEYLYNMKVSNTMRFRDWCHVAGALDGQQTRLRIFCETTCHIVSPADRTTKNQLFNSIFGSRY